jgi:hypothetical protein
MLENVANLLGDIAIYIAALLGLVVLYFLWGAFREWRTARRSVFGIERDIAYSEMMGALARAAGVVVIAIAIFAVGRLGQQAEPTEEASVEATQQPVGTISVVATPTAALFGSPAPTLLPTDTPQPGVTDVPALPDEATQLPAVEPTPQIGTVIVFGGVWLRDAPNGGTVEVMPQGTVVEFQEGREFAGSFEWQKVVVLSTPPGSEALVGQEGWVAASPEFLEVSP